jgi:hypothetical protein
MRTFPLALLGVLLATPATSIAQPSLSSLWPNDDGRSWEYAQHHEDLVTPITVDNRTRLFFDGTTVAPNSIEAQYLHQQLLEGTIAADALESRMADPFLRVLWNVRPDLRESLRNAADVLPCPQTGATGTYSILLNGEFAFRKTADEIAAWRCNFPDTKSWIWLVSDLTVGHEFTLQLVPDLASDVVLRGRVAAIELVTVPAGTFPNSVRVDYTVEFGASSCTDDGGNPTGTKKTELRGHVHYVEDVGPVESFEEILLSELTGTCYPEGFAVGEPFARTTMQMDELPTPARRRTWGRLKMMYR